MLFASSKEEENVDLDEKTSVSQATGGEPLDAPLIPRPGVVIDDRYEIESFVGKGGMSTVYKARHLHMDRLVALKFLKEGLIADNDALQRFKRESLAVSSLDHPNIVKAYGFGIAGRSPYMAMEYVQGTSLADVLKQEGRLSKEEALPLFEQILEALAHAHEKGVIHRDLKPSNVMLVGAERQPKLVDFGIAKILPETGQELQKLTQTGDVLGTVVYMSPEQCMASPLDSRSDLYSMGCLMYEVLDGEPPFKGDTALITIAKHLNEKPRASEYVTGDLGGAILKALEKEPIRRFQSARELNEALSNPEPHLLPKSQPVSYGKVAVLIMILLVAVFSFKPLPKSQKEVTAPHPEKNMSPFETERSLQRLSISIKQLRNELEKTKSGDNAEAERQERANDLVDQLRSLKDLYLSNKQYREAEAALLQALELSKVACPDTDQVKARLLQDLSDCNLRLSLPVRAEDFINQALACKLILPELKASLFLSRSRIRFQRQKVAGADVFVRCYPW